MSDELRPGPEHVILVETEGDTWLLQGEDHAEELLSGEGPYPKPVFSVRFFCRRSLARFLDPHGADTSGLWQINPAVIARLEAEGVICPMAGPEAG